MFAVLFCVDGMKYYVVEVNGCDFERHVDVGLRFFSRVFFLVLKYVQ